MSNEVIFIFSLLFEMLFILFASRRSSFWLYATIIINLILVGVFGAKLVSIFGFTTNVGNIFYACVFLATHLIIEKHGKKAGLKTVWYGVSFLLFFSVMSQLATAYTGLSINDSINGAIITMFSFSLRVTFASVIAFVFAQYINIHLYEWLKIKTKGRFLWIRSNGANIVAQLADSLLFFTIAFFDLSGPLLVQTILVGWSVKTFVVLMGTPFLYINKYLERKKI